MRALAVALLALVLAGTTSVARADSKSDRVARAHFAAGQSHFDLGEYDAAIESFQAGYRAKPLPLFLFNIAQAARKGGRTQLAVDSYARYLEREPARTAPQRTEAESWLGKLRRDQAEARDKAVEAAAAKAAGAPAPPPSSLTPPRAEPQAQASAPPAVSATSPRPVERPLYQKGWFWGTLAAVAVVGAGAGVGTWLALESRAPAKPSLGAVQFDGAHVTLRFDGARIRVGGAFDAAQR